MKCQNFQNWRRNLVLSSTVLALLVALVSVLSIGIPPIKTALTPKNADFRFAVQTVQQDGFSAFISNAGIRPGTILPGAYVRIIEQGGKMRRAILQSQMPNEEIIAPSASVLRGFTLTPWSYRTTIDARRGTSVTEVDDTFIRSKHEISCEVVFFVTDFVGRSRKPTVPFDCSKLPETKVPVIKPEVKRGEPNAAAPAALEQNAS